MSKKEITKPTTQAGTIREAISKKIKEYNPIVVEGIIETLAQEEIARRKNLVRKGIEKFEELEKGLKKMKPDNVAYNEQGEEISSGWTKAGLDAHTKTKKELETLNNALDNAINSCNYEPLSNIIK